MDTRHEAKWCPCGMQRWPHGRACPNCGRTELLTLAEWYDWRARERERFAGSATYNLD